MLVKSYMPDWGENPPRILSPVRHVTFNQQTYRDFLKNHHQIIHHVSRSRGRTRGSRAPEVRAYSVFHTAAGNPNETNRLPKARRAVTVHPGGMRIQVPPTLDGPPRGRSEGAGLEPQQINTTEQKLIASRSLAMDRGRLRNDRSQIVCTWSEPPPELPAYAGSSGADVLGQSKNPASSDETDEEDRFDPVSLRIPFKSVPTLGLETTLPGDGDPPKQGLDSDRSSGLTLQAKWEAGLYHAASGA